MSPNSGGIQKIVCHSNGGGQNIERYIGTCLIRSNSNPPNRKCEKNWVNGMPLYTATNSCPTFTNYHHRNQFSQLALHTQGVPLILSARNNRHRKPLIKPDGGNNKIINNQDTLSVTSDESCSSNSSENCLPRIIKPRKRRKKERKQPVVELKQQPTTKQIEVTPPSPTDVLLQDENGSTKCQCKLCDPCGQIWNTDVLKRSWSDPTSSSTKAAVIGAIGSERRQRIISSSLSSSSLAASSTIDISSEIVTSPDGHRDLEIKFLSFKPFDSCDTSLNFTKLLNIEE